MSPTTLTDNTETGENPLHRLTPEQIEEIGKEFQAIHDEVYADLGERDAVYIRSIIQFHRRLGAMSRAVLMASRYKPAWVLGNRRPVGGEDPREHGDRPQRPARPVGLDERSRDPLLDLGLGHRLARLGVEALPQLRPPHLHEHHRQGQGRRLRDHAGRSGPEVAPGLPLPAVLQRASDVHLRVGRRRPRPRLRGDPQGQEAEEAALGRAQGDRPQGSAARSSRTTSPSPRSAARSGRRRSTQT